MYKVFGYDSMCRDFEYSDLTFTAACKLYMELDKEGMTVVFVSGVSSAVESRLLELFFEHRGK